MDKSKIGFEDFEHLLQKESFRKPSALYNKVLYSNEQTYKPQDVIDTVCSQMKAIQFADSAKNVKSVIKILNNAKKTNFLHINKLPVYNEVHKPNPNKFETQCVSDTQLISLIEGAEAIDTHTGMTQEFDTTFLHIEDSTNANPKDYKENMNIPKFINSNVEKESKTSTLLAEGTSNIDKTGKNRKEVVGTENIYKLEDIEDHNPQKSAEIGISNTIPGEIPMAGQSTADLDFSSQFSKTATEDTITFIENMTKSQETNELKEETVELNKILNNTAVMDIDTGQVSQRSPSPVLNMKAKKRQSRTPSPLVVSLKSFENFENMAMPLIEENTDLDAVKHLINSQILGRELCLNSNIDVMLTERSNSPILEWKSDELQINSQDLNTLTVKQSLENVVSLHDIKNVNGKRNESLKDEILFSSDEENECIYKELQDLPLTCALEPPFYEESGVLEKTMYVGFQTASNKSIQICTDSFDHAKSILDDSATSIKELILTDLVENCDIMNSKPDKIINSIEETTTAKTESNAFRAIEIRSDPVTDEHNFVNDTKKEQNKEQSENAHLEISSEIMGFYTKEVPPKKQSFNGFMTASFKKNKIPDKALERCQKVFKHIDHNQNFDALIEGDLLKAKYNVERKTYLDENGKKEYNIKNLDDITIDEKINDELLLQELENIEMSLKGKETISEGNKHFGIECSNQISNKATAKTKKTFRDVDVEEKQKNENKAVIKTFIEKFPTRVMNSSVGRNNLICLQTASYQNINTSPQAFINTENMFQDIEIDNEVVTRDINQPSKNEGVFVGFNTANNKETKILNEAISKSHSLKDIDKINLEIEAIENVNQPSTSKSVFIGFKTANNKNINISDDALSKYKNIFKDIDKEISTLSVLEDKATTFKGFGTASNNNMKISHEAQSKSKTKFKDFDEADPEKEIMENINQPSTSKAVFIGFKTSNNKNINISDDALSKYKNIFKDIDKECSSRSVLESSSHKNDEISEQVSLKSRQSFENIDIDDCINIPQENSIVQDTNTKFGFENFKTANNKAVNISAEALLKSKNLFADLDSKNFDSKAVCCAINKNVNTTFKGFQTASNKTVSVSADAVRKSKRIFQEIDEADEIIHKKCLKKAEIGGNLIYQGFQTASKKTVTVSAAALAKTKIIFQDIEKEDEIISLTALKTSAVNENPIFEGFQTANKKAVTISADALARSKIIFEDICKVNESMPEKVPKNISSDGFEIFKTKNSEPVEVYKESVSGTFSDLNDAQFENLRSNCFNTASKKIVNISEEALLKSKKLFDDIEVKHFNVQTNLLTDEAVSYENKKYLTLDKKISSSIDLEINKDVAINTEGILNTQVLNDFEENLCTEDFKHTPRPIKRSGSPILSCPKAKKRKKFQPPHKSMPKTLIDFNKNINVTKKPVNIITFKENYKKHRKHSLQDLTNLENNSNKTIDPYILNFNLENILDFEFDGVRNDLKEGEMNIEELKRLFAEATDKKLIPEGWMDIHLKLILWKLISYEIKFPNSLGTVCTVRNVIDQLKHRYDRELYDAQRPVLRKILEKDDVPTKAMVLCVVGIYVDGVSVISVANLTNIELLLTDGWYFVKATIDKMLSKLVYDGKIVVGSKILTCGAELVNCEQGVAPWEDTSSIRLNISGNSTKPARWWTRLGRQPAGMLCRLSDVKVDGGKASRLRAQVARVYPPLYVERLQDGSTVTRSERLEHQYQMKYEAEREVMVEKIYEQVEMEFSNQESQDTEGSLRNCDSGSQIAQLMKKSKDPMEFRAQLTPTQIQILQDHVSKQRDKYLQAVQDKIRDTLRPRSVVTLARGRVAALDRDKGIVTVTRGMLSIWKPNDAVLDIFKEGACIEVTNVVPTAVRNSEIQLSAGRQSVFRQIKCKEDEILKPYLEPLKRICYNIKELSQNPSMITNYNEIDTVGIIFSIDPLNRDFESIKNQFQNVYLADIDKNMICVNFWGGIKKFGFVNVLDTGQVIYCGNLQKRAGSTRKNIPQYRATEFSLFTKTPKNEKGRETVDEMNKKMCGLDRRKFCEDCIAVKQNYSVIKCLIDSENVSPYRFNNSNYNLDKHKMFIETTIGLNVNKGKPEDFRLTGLDFESTFKQEDTQELSPKTLLRKKKVNEKIAKLKMYGEPPPLTPINIINKSKNAANSYKSPLISKSDNVDTPKKAPSATSVNNLNAVTTMNLPDKCAKTDNVGNGTNLPSPIISMNRTYVKRSSVKPVKLNFSETATIEEKADITFDHFAEEFDGSPPLSLD